MVEVPLAAYLLNPKPVLYYYLQGEGFLGLKRARARAERAVGRVGDNYPLICEKAGVWKRWNAVERGLRPLLRDGERVDPLFYTRQNRRKVVAKKVEKKQSNKGRKTRLADKPLAECLQGLEKRIIDLEGALKAHIAVDRHPNVGF